MGWTGVKGIPGECPREGSCPFNSHLIVFSIFGSALVLSGDK